MSKKNIVIGFGITNKTIASLKKADGLVVGSQLCKSITNCLKKTNLFLLSLSFLIFTILWVFPFLGFGSPIALLGGFILGKWLGSLVVVLGLSIGATFLYIFGNFYLKNFLFDQIIHPWLLYQHQRLLGKLIQ